MVWESCFPCSTLVFAQTVQTVSLRPRPPCSPLLSVLALFFLFFIRTCQLRCRRRRRLHLASPSHRRYPVGATSTPQLPHQPRGRYNRRHVTLCGEPSTRWTRSLSHASWAHTSHPAACERERVQR